MPESPNIALTQELMRLSAKYVWWKKPAEAVHYPGRVASQVMNLGEFDDIQQLAAIAGEGFLKDVIKKAEVGTFSPRAWHYWHYRLGLAEVGCVPKMPERVVPYGHV